MGDGWGTEATLPRAAAGVPGTLVPAEPPCGPSSGWPVPRARLALSLASLALWLAPITRRNPWVPLDCCYALSCCCCSSVTRLCLTL